MLVVGAVRRERGPIDHLTHLVACEAQATICGRAQSERVGSSLARELLGVRFSHDEPEHVGCTSKAPVNSWGWGSGVQASSPRSGLSRLEIYSGQSSPDSKSSICSSEYLRTRSSTLAASRRRAAMSMSVCE